VIDVVEDKLLARLRIRIHNHHRREEQEPNQSNSWKEAPIWHVFSPLPV
jgi:hypothetical protein